METKDSPATRGQPHRQAGGCGPITGVRGLSAIHTEPGAQGEWGGGKEATGGPVGPGDTVVLPCGAHSLWQLCGVGVVHGGAEAS